MALTFRELRPDDRFPSEDPAFRWRAERNPAGTITLGAFEGEEPRAACSLVLHDLWAAGKERKFGELIELRGGPELILCVRGLLEEHGHPKAATVVYAWPSAAHGRMLERMQRFETVRSETWLKRDVSRAPAAAETEPSVETLSAFDEQARWLFDRCAGAFGAAVVRDAAFLNWRFDDDAGVSFLRLGVRDGEGILRGYAVLEARPTEGEVRLVDWLVPADEPEVGERLQVAASAAARAAGAHTLATVLVPWSPWFTRFQTWGYRVEPARSFLLAKSSVRKLDDLWLRDGWWTTLADRSGLSGAMLGGWETS